LNGRELGQLRICFGVQDNRRDERAQKKRWKKTKRKET